MFEIQVSVLQMTPARFEGPQLWRSVDDFLQSASFASEPRHLKVLLGKLDSDGTPKKELLVKFLAPLKKPSCWQTTLAYRKMIHEWFTF